MYIDFSIIKTGEEFELLCEDLLKSIGFGIESQVGRGPDQGKDIIAIQTLTDKAGISETHRYLVECKHNAVSGKSVQEPDIGNPIGRMSVHNCDRYILITSTVPSENVKSQIKNISNPAPTYKATIWSRGDLRKLLYDHPEVRSRYFKPVIESESSRNEPHEQVIQTLKKYLALPGHFNNLRKLLLQHPECLPIETYMFSAYEFRTNVRVPEGGIVDCIAARPDTGGIKGYMYYFGSPYDNPFTESGEPQRELACLLELAHKHASIVIGSSLSSEHVLHPTVVTGLELAGMKQFYFDYRHEHGFGPYGSLNIYVIIGQRSYHSPRQDIYQINSIGLWKAKFKESNQGVIEGCEIRLDILSYNRLMQCNNLSA